MTEVTSAAAAQSPVPDGWIVLWPWLPCQNGQCPTVYVDDAANGSVIVQGYELDDSVITTLGKLPDGESAIRVPKELIIGAYEQLRATGEVPA